MLHLLAGMDLYTTQHSYVVLRGVRLIWVYAPFHRYKRPQKCCQYYRIWDATWEENFFDNFLLANGTRYIDSDLDSEQPTSVSTSFRYETSNFKLKLNLKSSQNINSTPCMFELKLWIVNISLSIFIDTFGPMSYQFCRFNFVIKNSIIFHLVLMVQFIILAKYFSIFVLKNPTELYNEFWCFYLNILCLVLALVFQTAFIVLPGKNPLDFSICTGTNPAEFNTNYQKVNFSLQIIAVLCVALYIMVCLRVKMFSQKSVHLLGQCFPTRVQGKHWVPCGNL